MKQALTESTGRIVYQEVPEPIPGKGEALIEIKSVGICNSDIIPYKGGLLDIMPLPFVMGHEFGGIIKEINGESKDFKIGDKVAIYPEINCGSCYYCTHGMEILCPDQILIGSPKREGGLSERKAVPLSNLIRLNKSFDIKYAGLIEPAAVAYHTIGEVKDSNVIVIGVGAIGAMMGQILKYNNCKFIAMDIEERALEISRKLGADFVINLKDKNIINEIKDFLGREKVDVVVITYINQENLDLSLEIVKKGGTIIEMSTTTEKYELDFKKIFFKALNLKGSICYSKSEFKEAANLIEKGIITKEIIVTDIFTLNKTKEAFEYKVNNFALKVLITNNID